MNYTKLLLICCFSFTLNKVNAKVKLGLSLHAGMAELPVPAGWFSAESRTYKPFGFGEFYFEQSLNKKLFLKSGVSISYFKNKYTFEVSGSNALFDVLRYVSVHTSNSLNLGLPILIGIEYKKFQFDIGVQLSHQIFNKKVITVEDYQDNDLAYFNTNETWHYFENSGWGLRLETKYNFSNKLAFDFSYQNQMGALFETSPSGFLNGHDQFSLGISYKFQNAFSKKGKGGQLLKGAKSSIGIDGAFLLVFFKRAYKNTDGQVTKLESNAKANNPVISPQVTFIYSPKDSALLNVRIGVSFQNLKYTDLLSDRRSMFGSEHSDTFSIQSVILDLAPQVSIKFDKLRTNFFVGIRTSITTKADIKGLNDWYCAICGNGLNGGNDAYSRNIKEELNAFDFGPILGAQIEYKVGKHISINYALSSFISMRSLFKEESTLYQRYNIMKVNSLINSVGITCDIL
jgi:hypothetical protein